MNNNLDYLYSQLNELNSKIGSTYNYIDSNNLDKAKIDQLNLKCDYMIARANKIQSKINILEKKEQEAKQEENNNKTYIILTIILSIITIIYVITAIL